MEHSIKYRLLVDQLNKKEFNLFISRLLDSCSRNFFVSALFTHFNKNDNNLDTVTNIISNIIKSREEKQNEASYDRLDKIPSSLIGHTASFLHFNDYLNYQKCNRSIYIGCNSPCKLHALPPLIMNKYPKKQSMNKYKFVNEVPINIKHFNSLSIENQLTWNNNNINYLLLSNCDGDHNDLNIFINNNYIHYNTLKEVGFVSFGNINTPFPAPSFCKLFENSVFSNIEYLRLQDVHLTPYNGYNVTNATEITSWFPKLRGFCHFKSDMFLSKHIIQSFGNNLESLLVYGLDDVDDSTQFTKLKELLCYFSHNILNSVIRSNASLQRIIISENNIAPLQDAIKKVMQTQIKLQTFVIAMAIEHLSKAMEQFESSLFDIRDFEKEYFQLQIRAHVTTHWSEDIVKEMHLLIFRVVNILNLSKMKHFQFGVTIEIDSLGESIDYKTETMQKWINVLESMKSNYNVYITTHDKKHTFVFSSVNAEFDPSVCSNFTMPYQLLT